MKTAWLFPGQGTFFQQDLLQWFDESPHVLKRVSLALEMLAMTRADIQPRNFAHLDQTQILQPLFTALLIGIHEKLCTRGIQPDYVAGHSLGEIAAWSASGGISGFDAIALAAARGKAMHDQAASNPGSMVSVQLGSFTESEILTASGAHGSIDLAARNTPASRVFAGDRAALHFIVAHFGGVMLDVAGPWHARSMAPAKGQFQAQAAEIRAVDSTVPMVSNRDGRIVSSCDEIPALLADQLTAPIQWVAVMETLQRHGVGRYVLLGPAKILRGLVRDCLSAVAEVHLIHDMASLERYLNPGPIIGRVTADEK